MLKTASLEIHTGSNGLSFILCTEAICAPVYIPRFSRIWAHNAPEKQSGTIKCMGYEASLFISSKPLQCDVPA